MTSSTILQALKSALWNRQKAYRTVFSPQNPYLGVVLADLAKFCRAHDSTFHSDPRVHAILEGRREVWLRIARNLNLTPDELWGLYSKEEK